MKVRFVILVIVLSLGVVSLFRCLMQLYAPAATVSTQSAMAQKPRRWVAGDTLWFEIDSIPRLPSAEELLIDSLLMVYPELDLSVLHPDSLYRYKLPEHIRLNYSVPYWSVYRRSLTLWGITFSTGQIPPYSPYPSAGQDATVLSFPLQPPR